MCTCEVDITVVTILRHRIIEREERETGVCVCVYVCVCLYVYVMKFMP